MRQDGFAVASRLVLARGKGAAQLRLNAVQAEQVQRGAHGGDVLGLTRDRQVQLRRHARRELREGPVAVAVILIIRV